MKIFRKLKIKIKKIIKDGKVSYLIVVGVLVLGLIISLTVALQSNPKEAEVMRNLEENE